MSGTSGEAAQIACAAAVSAALIYRLCRTSRVTVALPGTVATIDVDDDSTLTQLLARVSVASQAPDAAISAIDVTIGDPDGPLAIENIPVRLHRFAGDDGFLAERLRTLGAALVAEPERPVRELSPVGPAEREMLIGFNPVAGTPPTTPVHELICRQATRTPEAIAMESAGKQWTYRDLLDEAAAVAARLRADGVAPGAVVALCTPRSGEMVIAVLGILLAGAAYLPLDPSHPANRLGAMLETAAARWLLIDPEHVDSTVVTRGIRIRTLAGEPVSQAADAVAAAAPLDWRGYRAPADVVDGLSYVIFTSGSTGRPKGVQMTHASLANRLVWMQEEYRISPQDTVLHKTPYTFDVSVWELLWAFCAGARLVVAPPAAHRDPQQIVQLVQREGVTVIHFVPSMLALFVAEPGAAGCTSLRLIICSGEALIPKLANKTTALLPSAALHNLYGPTEAAIDVTAWRCRRPEPGSSVPIGRPIANVAAYVLDDAGNLCAVGVPGELVVGGACLAAGYAASPELTAARFVTIEVAGTRQRVYRTGDLAWWSPEGHLNYAGRIDDQVKIRGQRVEPGEIESVLARHANVAASVVVLREDLGTVPVLVGYVVPEDPADPPSERALRAHLAEDLPEHMIPLRYVILPKLPTTANGKVHRRGLPAPTARSRRRAQA